MTLDVVRLAWPVDRLPDALEQLSAHVGYGASAGESSPHDPAVEPSRAWMGALAARFGVELEPVVPLYSELPEVLERAAPALLQLRHQGRPLYLLLLGARRGVLRLLGPDGVTKFVKREVVLQCLRREKQAKIVREVDALIAGLDVSGSAREGIRGKLLLQQLGRHELRTCWILRPLPTARAASLLGSIPALVAGILINHLLLSLVLAGSFWMLGRAALQARLDEGWFLGWIAVVASSIPLRLLEVWWQGLFSLRLGSLLKQRLLVGVLRLTPDEVRLDGIGRHFGRVAEAEVVELLALGGGLLAVLSLLDLVLAGVILWRGAGGWLHVGSLAVWISFALLLAFRHYRAQRRWSAQRVGLTHDLLERMLGHRTRLAQLPLDQWHDTEDRRLAEYHETSRVMDERSSELSGLLPGGWLVVALLGLLPTFARDGSNVTDLAISVGGILLAMRAFDEIAAFFQQLSLAAASFEELGEVLRAALRPEPAPQIPLAFELGTTTPSMNGETLLEARGLSFQHHAQSRAILDNCSMQIARGDRILLEGPSGGGKSTLVSLLTGMRSANAGVLLLRGLDRATLGASGWRRRVSAAPQFHENHVLSGSFAYNLLLGREWPVSAGSRAEAQDICRELGLEELIAKMPSGLDELIGETGWQLSHGEKSRLYIARTLLQGVDLVILDESFASLDPETMAVAVRCVLARAPALLVVSHP